MNVRTLIVTLATGLLVWSCGSGEIEETDAGFDAGQDADSDPGADPGGDPGSDPGGDPGGDTGSDPGCIPDCAGRPCGQPDGCGSVCEEGAGCLRSCESGGIEIAHGESRVFYEQEEALFGSSCDSFAETRTCTDGELSGSFPYPACMQEHLKVLLWNILVAGWEPDGIAHWDAGRRDEVIALMESIDPDVMLLQEVTRGMYDDLEAHFSSEYERHYMQKTAGSLHGNAIFSKLPLRNKGGFYIDDRGRNCAAATIRGVNIYSCHLPNTNYTDEYRLAAARVVADQIESPLVLGGDLNTQGGIGILDIVKNGYASCGRGVDHLVTDQTCEMTEVLLPADHDYPSDHAALVFRVPR